MKTEQRLWTEKEGWVLKSEPLTEIPQLVFVFGARTQVEKQEHFDVVRQTHPDAKIVSCSTAGEILGTRVYDNSLSVTAVHFEKTRISCVTTNITSTDESEAKGREIAGMLERKELAHVMVFSDGLKVNGAALVRGVTDVLGDGISATGGLVGDGSDFKLTVSGLDEVPQSGKIICIGFYGSHLKVGYGSLGGWDTFGPDRTITRSKDNVLYELDERPALELYKEYLGDLASELPGSGLLFPIRLKLGEGEDDIEVVRTLLAVNEEDQSMAFAGDMPEGVTATLMKANFERLVDGATGAAKMSSEHIGPGSELAILISCVGRKLVLKNRIEEETEAVEAVLGKGTTMAGFYSYGEICPVAANSKQCQLHNQTMTITTFKEE